MTTNCTHLAIFCDFDGTFLPEDVGNLFFETFSGPSMWEDNRLYKEGAIRAQELYRRNARKIEGITEEKIDAFCEPFRIDPEFHAFYEWVQASGHAFTILSDGMDAYVQRILASAGVDVPFKANHLEIMPDGTVEIAFPYSFPDCTCSANCKRNQLLLHSGDDDYTVYIGDGMSDFCPAEYADLVFAKGALQPFCQQKNITYRTFTSFRDVLTALTQITSKKRLKKSLRAELLRKAVWMSG